MDDMDERLKNELADEAGESNLRAPRGGGAGRRSRESDDRQMSEDREVTDDDRFEMFRLTQYNDVLPDIPKIPGFHVCWLSTTHPNDTIARRSRLGYVPVRPEEVKGMEFATLKTGEYAGLIGVNEMVAFKISESLYQRFMQETHHDEPARQVESILSQADQLKEQAMRDGGRLVEGDGMEDMRRSNAPRGRFS